jgi:hypothetical protein
MVAEKETNVSRLASLTAVFGGIVMLIGLIVLGTTFSQPKSEATRAFAMLLSSFGALMVSVPLYVDARRLQLEYRRTESQAAKRNLSPCSVCGAPTATFWCTTHTQKLCPDCVTRHDDPTRCLYKSLRYGPMSVIGSARATNRA